MNLSENLKRIRKEHNLSQEDLADKLGVSRQSVSKWESGISYPEMDKMLKLCELFNLNIDELLNQDIKKINETKQSKNNLNKFIDSFLNYITKTINMFSSMTFKQKIKCIIEQLLIIFFIFILFKILGSILSSISYKLLNLLPNTIHSYLYLILESIYTIIAYILGIILLLHTFKIRYLDYYVLINDTPKEETENKEIYLEKKQEKIIIRDPNHSEYKFISGLLKIFLILIKIFLAFFSLNFCFTLIFLCISLVSSFLIIKTGLLFTGIFLIIISSITINIIILYIIFNFLINKKTKYLLLGIIFIISLILIGIGTGITIISIKDFNIVDTSNTKYFIKDEYNYQMTDNLFIHDSPKINYIESNNNDIKIEVLHSKYNEIKINYNNNSLTINNYIDYNYMDIIRNTIDTFNDKKIVDYNDITINIYTTKDNIEKLNQNKEKYYQDLNNLYND